MRLVVAALSLPGMRRLTSFGRQAYLGAVIGACLGLSAGLAGAQDAAPALSGMWSTTVTAVEHPDWTIEDLFAWAKRSGALP